MGTINKRQLYKSQDKKNNFEKNLKFVNFNNVYKNLIY